MSSNSKMRNIGRLIRAQRMARGLRQRDLAAALGLRSVHYIGMLESGLSKGIGLGRLEEIADILGVHGTDRHRWMAAAEHLPVPLWTALMKNPERWNEIQKLLGGSRAASGRGKKKAGTSKSSSSARGTSRKKSSRAPAKARSRRA